MLYNNVIFSYSPDYRKPHRLCFNLWTGQLHREFKPDLSKYQSELKMQRLSTKNKERVFSKKRDEILHKLEHMESYRRKECSRASGAATALGKETKQSTEKCEQKDVMKALLDHSPQKGENW